MARRAGAASGECSGSHHGCGVPCGDCASNAVAADGAPVPWLDEAEIRPAALVGFRPAVQRGHHRRLDLRAPSLTRGRGVGRGVRRYGHHPARAGPDRRQGDQPVWIRGAARCSLRIATHCTVHELIGATDPGQGCRRRKLAHARGGRPRREDCGRRGGRVAATREGSSKHQERSEQPTRGTGKPRGGGGQPTSRMRRNRPLADGGTQRRLWVARRLDHCWS
mmetsp:Transcript_4015/g.9679  ORF Transcript_4015/g.9679 Transcript_4015/m.9679 type:complete len:222 (-) Transcript_4015:101-766(-)